MAEAFTVRFEPKRYLDRDGNLRLPEPMRAYIGPSGYEMDQLDDEQRLADLGYLITRGWDFRQALRDYLDDHEEYESYIQDGLYNLLLKMRGYEGASWLDPDEHKATGYQLMNLFVKDIWTYYELDDDKTQADDERTREPRPIMRHPSEHGIKEMIWDVAAMVKEHHLTKDDIYELQKKTTSEWIRDEYPFKKEE